VLAVAVLGHRSEAEVWGLRRVDGGSACRGAMPTAEGIQR